MHVRFTIILCKQSCGRGLFPKNLPRVNYTQTCHRISTLQRQSSTGRVTVNIIQSTDKSRALPSILSLPICFITFVPIFLHILYPMHSCTAHIYSCYLSLGGCLWFGTVPRCHLECPSRWPGTPDVLRSRGTKGVHVRGHQRKKKVESSLAVSETEGCCLAARQIYCIV